MGSKEESSTTQTQVFKKTHEYAAMFALQHGGEHAQHEMLQQIREKVLGNRGLHEFEIASLANLAPESPDEAKALIPSLAREELPDEVIEDILRDLHSYLDQT